MEITVISAIIGAIIASVVVFFCVKAFASPRRVETVQNLLDAGKYEAAVRAGKILIAKRPQDADAHYVLGKAYLADKKDVQALVEFKFINDNAIFERTHIVETEFRGEAARLFLKTGQKEEALKEFLLLIKLQPMNAEHYFQAGQLFEDRQNVDQAINYYRQTLAFDSDHYSARRELARLLLLSRQYAEAMKEFKTALELKADDYSLYYYIGMIYREMKEYSVAIAMLEKALRSADFQQVAYIELGICYLASDNAERAAEAFNRGVQCARDPRSQETLLARYRLADCCEKNHKIEEALAQWKEIARVDGAYKNVTEKLDEYADAQSNSSLREYLVSGQSRFNAICQEVAAQAFDLTDSEIITTKYGAKITASEKNSRHITLLYFFRDPEPVPESMTRLLVEEVKANSARKGIACSSSGFDRFAESYAEGRAIELFGKVQLADLLAKAGI
jgi:tetratricopeptide (TPR) repeat protein